MSGRPHDPTPPSGNVGGTEVAARRSAHDAAAVTHAPALPNVEEQPHSECGAQLVDGRRRDVAAGRPARRALRLAALSTLAVVAVGCGSAPGASPVTSTSPSPDGAFKPAVTTHRTAMDGVRLALGVSTGCVDTLQARGKRGHGTLSLLATRTGNTPSGVMELLDYEPFSGAAVAYVAGDVRTVEWRSTRGRVLDRMRPWHRWVAEVGPPLHPPSAPVPAPSEREGTLVAMGQGGKVLGSLTVSTENTMLTLNSGPAPCLSTTRKGP